MYIFSSVVKIQFFSKYKKKRRIMLVCDCRRRIVTINDNVIDLPPSQFVIYLYFLIKKTVGCNEKNITVCGDCVACFEPLFRTKRSIGKLLRFYKEIYGDHSKNYERLRTKLQDRKSNVDAMFLQKISKINKQFRYRLNDLADPVLISSEGKYVNKVYGIKLDKNRINILNNV